MRSIMGRLLDLSEQQGRLLESLLTLAKSEGGLDHRGPLDLAEMAERMVRTAEGTAPGLAGTTPGPVRQSVPGLTGEPPGPVAGTPDWCPGSRTPQRRATRHWSNGSSPTCWDNAVRYNVPRGRSVLLMLSPRAW